jgi:signal transduction histidine kinase
MPHHVQEGLRERGQPLRSLLGHAALDVLHDRVRVVAIPIGTVVAIFLGARTELAWVTMIVMFAALSLPVLRLRGRLERDPQSAMIVDLYFAAAVATIHGTRPTMVMAVAGTTTVAAAILGELPLRVAIHALTAAGGGWVFFDSVVVTTGTPSIMVVAVTLILAAVMTAVGTSLWIQRQIATRFREERDVAEFSLTAALDVSNVSIMVIDEMGRIVSKAGWKAIPVAGATSYREALAEIPAIIDVVSSALEGNQVQASVMAVERVYNVAATPLIRDGGMWGVSLGVSDITEPVAASRRSDQASRWKSDFIASVSHEIRTPLTAVLGFASELARTKHGLDTEGREYLDILTDQAREAAHIVEDLLVATRKDVGELAILTQQLDLMAETELVVSALTSRSDRISLDGVPTPALGDRTRVRQIIRNLVTNAVKYGGRDVRIVVNVENEAATVAVYDNGGGIPMTSREMVFQPFYQVGARNVPGGFGLGLSVARTLAQLMGGHLIYGYSKGWSCFRLTLPCADPAIVGAPVEVGGRT